MTKQKKPRKTSPANRRKTGVPHDLVEAGKNTRFQPGKSGNPLGRPRTKIFRNIAREIVEMVDTKKKKQRARVLIDTLFKHAEKGSLGHFKEIHKLLEEDSTDRRIELTAGPISQPARMSKEELLNAVRHIYGLSLISDTPAPASQVQIADREELACGKNASLN